jgi:SAM-dependent methyltransferase
MDADRRWLTAQWPFVRAYLPAAPARVLEVGCGPLGGFVPAARALGHTAEGVDPQAPDEAGYHRLEFEDYPLAEPAEAVVACTSLHHVANLDLVLDRVHDVLTPGGTLIVVEWARERFDEPTARWCFAHLTPATDLVEPGPGRHHGGRRADRHRHGRLPAAPARTKRAG